MATAKHRTTFQAQSRIVYTSPLGRVVIVRHAADDFELRFDGVTNSSYASESRAIAEAGFLLHDEAQRTRIESADIAADVAALEAA
jgi:hypothetical protein